MNRKYGDRLSQTKCSLHALYVEIPCLFAHACIIFSFFWMVLLAATNAFLYVCIYYTIYLYHTFTTYTYYICNTIYSRQRQNMQMCRDEWHVEFIYILFRLSLFLLFLFYLLETHFISEWVVKESVSVTNCLTPIVRAFLFQ